MSRRCPRVFPVESEPAGAVRPSDPGKLRNARWTPGPSEAGSEVAGRDRGNATVWAAIVLAVLILLTGAGLHLGSAAIARHRAETAADLAALAAAAQVLHGPEIACETARRVAAANAAGMTSCVLAGFDVLVQTEVPTALFGSAHARARAGPADEVFRPGGSGAAGAGPRPDPATR